jgi:hypothetical protein
MKYESKRERFLLELFCHHVCCHPAKATTLYIAMTDTPLFKFEFSKSTSKYPFKIFPSTRLNSDMSFIIVKRNVGRKERRTHSSNFELLDITIGSIKNQQP